MNTPEEQERYEQVYQKAVTIMEQEWMDAEKTREELNQEKQLTALFGRLLASGRSEEEIEAEWAGKSNAEIVRAYANLFLCRGARKRNIMTQQKLLSSRTS